MVPTRTTIGVALKTLKDIPFRAYLYYSIERFRRMHDLKDNLFTVPGAISLIAALGTFPFTLLHEEGEAPIRDMDVKLNMPERPEIFSKNKPRGKKWKKRKNKQKRTQDSVLKHAEESATPLRPEEPKQGTMKDPPASQKKAGKDERRRQELLVPGQGLSVEGSFGVAKSTGYVATVENFIEQPRTIVAAEDISIDAMDPDDPRAYLPVPQQNTIVEPRDPNHDLLSWTACYDDSCPVHLSDKNGTGYFPCRPWRHWR